MQNLLRILLIFTAVSMAGCSTWHFPGVFRINIAQGNLITKDMVEKLRVGMTPRQVRYVMGSPMIHDPFHPDRWDYLYYLKTGKGIVLRNHLVLYFKDDRLARVDKSEYENPDQLREDLFKQLGIKAPKDTTASGTPEPKPEPRQEGNDGDAS